MSKTFKLLCIVFILLLLTNEPLLAGAGGSIAKAVTKSFWGKLLIFIIVVFFLPFILYNFFKEKIAIRNTMKDLSKLSKINNNFNWLFLKARASDIFTRVQSSWDKNNLDEASEWMDQWYWQNQKYVHLDEWERRGLKNYVKIKNIENIKPLYLEYNESTSAENSRIILSITATMQDFLAQISDQLIVEGDKEFKEVETVWTLILKNNKWVVENIEQAVTTLDYVKMKNIVPSTVSQFGSAKT